MQRPDLRDRCAAALLHSQKVKAVFLTTMILLLVHAKPHYYMYTRLVIVVVVVVYARSAGWRKFLASIRSHLYRPLNTGLG